MTTPRPYLTILTALPFESRLALRLGLRPSPRPADIPSFCGTVAKRLVVLLETGLRAKRLFSLAGGLAELDPRAGILSMGLAGGLSPTAPAVLTAREVTHDGSAFAADEALTADLAAAGAAPVERLVTTDRIVSRAVDKEALHASTGADAVDMESGLIAHWARDRDIPFAVLRGISDPAGSTLPRGIERGRPDGLRSIPAFALLALRSLKARRRLGTVLRRFLAGSPPR